MSNLHILSRRRGLIAVAAATAIASGALLTGRSFLQAQIPQPQPQPSSSSSSLPACEGNRTLFPLPPSSIPAGKDLVDVWILSYHGRITEIMDAHFAPQRYACSEEDARKATEELAALAKELGPWEGSEEVSEDSLGSILLEYLRVYECTLREHDTESARQVEKDLRAMNPLLPALEFSRELSDRAQKMEEELRTARPTIHRLLATIGTLDRLRPLQSGLECLERSSLDIRNILGLASDASACLPRALDARGSLRDLPTYPVEQ